MFTFRQPGMRVLSGSVLLICLVAPYALAAEREPTESQVKAAYLYNFGKFIEWPGPDASQGSSPFRLCVFNDKSFELTLREVVNGKSIGPHPVAVVPVYDPAQGRDCQILFISVGHGKDALQILQELRNTRVVTVGEMDGFLEAGGTINFVLEDDHVRFQVNEKAASHADLHISSRLLAVARLVVR